MTGGPNGDVAGNMIKIMNRDQKKRAKFVGIVDHTGGMFDFFHFMRQSPKIAYGDVYKQSIITRDALSRGLTDAISLANRTFSMYTPP